VGVSTRLIFGCIRRDIDTRDEAAGKTTYRAGDVRSPVRSRLRFWFTSLSFSPPEAPQTHQAGAQEPDGGGYRHHRAAHAHGEV
jgi:hypothetical protein